MNPEDEEIEKDVLKLQIHSLPLNLNWNQSDEEEEEENDEDFPSSHLVGTGSSSSQNLQPTASMAETASHPIYESNEDLEDEDEDLIDIDLSADFAPTPFNLLKLNFAYQEVVEQQIAMVDRLLQENHYKKSVMLESMNRASVEPEKPPRLECGLFNKLLFKDDQGCGPSNPDIERIKGEVGPGFSPNFLPPSKWKKATDQNLTSGILSEAQRKLMDPLMAQLGYIEEKMETSKDPQLKSKAEEVKKKMEAVNSLPRDQLLGNRQMEWDWDTISNISLKGEQDPVNCALRWKNYLHPSINRGPWRKEEDEDLLRLSQEHKDHDWRVIAESMDTGRSVVDVVKRYQLKINPAFKSRPWTPEEDIQLLQLVEKYRVGGVVPYTQIALHMKNRHATQIVHRWTKSLDPSIKRHRFTPQEDAALLRAVMLHGQKWSRIRDLGLIPGRSDAQLRERYTNVLDGTQRRSSWTKEEDLQLIRLVKEVGEGNWTAIASRMENRADCQCLRRWNALKEHLRTGSRLSYRSDKAKVLKLMKVRDNLRRAIDAELEAKKKKRLEAEQEIVRSQEDSVRLSEDQSQNDSLMSSDAVVKVYSNLTDPIPSRVIKKPLHDSQLDPVFVDLCRITDSFYQPRCVEALKEGSHLSRIREGIVRRSEIVGAKEAFVHFIKALNINAERTLEKIKRKSGRSKDNKSSSKSCSSFTRNLYLPLCAPNRATVRAYRSLTKDRERRVNKAKSILLLPESDGASEDPEKHDPESLLAELRATYKYKIFRSRFNALFTWPTLLSSLVPYLRKLPDSSLYSTIRKRRTTVNRQSAKKRKMTE